MSAVDVLVSDIYGSDESSLKELGLKGDVIAASFGKVPRKPEKNAGTTEIPVKVVALQSPINAHT